VSRKLRRQQWLLRSNSGPSLKIRGPFVEDGGGEERESLVLLGSDATR
jgi:hypothetical protein